MKLYFKCKKYFCSYFTTILIVIVAGIIGYTICAAHLSSIPFYKSIISHITLILKSLLLPIFAGVIGYILGVAKSFREQQLKTYIDSIYILAKAAFEHKNFKDKDNTELNKAIYNMWIYGSIKVAKQYDKIVSILVKPERGDKVEELQKLVVDMRNNLQLSPCQRLLKPDDIKHLYLNITNKGQENHHQ